jgi:hypothetical protein
MKKTFYCVQSEFYDNGMVKAAIIRQKEAVAKPANTYRSWPRMDAYQDWFENRREAERFVLKAKAA